MSTRQIQITPIAFNPESSMTEGLKPAPIHRDWILEGTPEARKKDLARSEDGTSWNMFWECTAGRFNWHYDNDETAFIVSGEVFITTGTTRERRFGPGDMIFFPAGSSCTWRIPVLVKKFAVLRQTMPRPFAFAVKAWNKIIRKLNRNSGSVMAVWFAVRFFSPFLVET